MYTKNDVLNLVEEEDVEFIRLQFTDVFGTMKNMAVTRSQLESVIDHGCMFDGAAIDGFVKLEESDLYLKPDLDTLEIFPWRPQQGKVARLICDVYKPDGTPFEGDSRYILKKVVKEAEEMGYTFNVGPECEFFLFHTDDNGLPTTITHEHAGYFDLSPLDLGENAKRDMILNLEEMGFEIESSHHEMAPAQHEIDFKYADAMSTADNIMTFKLTVRDDCKKTRAACVLYGKAEGRGKWFRNAYEYVIVERWCQYICRSGEWTQQRGILFYCGYYETYQGNVAGSQSYGQFLQTSGTGI